MKLRPLLLLAVVALFLTAGASEVLAQTWPSMDLPVKNWRGAGGYLSWVKVLACWVVFLLWVRGADWVNTDCQELRLDFLRWNPVVFGSFMAAFVLVWLVPIFWVGFPLLVVAFLAPLITYIVHRNSKVTNDLRVFTPAHIRYWVAVRLNKLGMKIAVEAQDPLEKGPPVKLTGQGGQTAIEDNARTLAVRQSLGLLPAREVLYDALSFRAAAIMLDYAPQAVSQKYLVDGVWLDRDPLEREKGDPALEALKIVSGLNSQDRQNRQNGTFSTEYNAIKYISTLSCLGTKTGERAVVQFEDKKIRFDTVEELGIRSKLQEQLNELLALDNGFLLFSAMPASGLRTTADVVIRHTDRFTREFMAVEEETRPYEKIENCPVLTYKEADGQSPASILPKLFRMQPDVLVVRDLVNGETVKMIGEEMKSEGLLALSTIRAKDSVDALLRVLALGVPPERFAEMVSGVVGQRLIRKLCEKCKEAYTPAPEVLKQLGIPQGRIQAFYRPPSQPREDGEVCEECSGIGYRGRTAVFELLVVGETVRKVLPTNPKPDVLRQAARKDGMASLQEEGILLVAKGVTSLPELMRVLKQ